MIPPNAMERARLAFWNEDGNLDMKLNAAFRSLSAAWPVADGRRLSTDLTEEQWARFCEHLNERGWIIGRNMAAMREAFRAALSPPSAPAADVRIVRVAVVADDDDRAQAWVFQGKETADDAWRWARSAGYPIRLCIAEIPVPVRDVPTVRASVTEAPHD